MRDIPALADREELERSSMDVRTPLQPAVVTLKEALSIKPFGLDMNVLLTTETTGGAVIVAWHKPAEGPPTMSISNRKKFCSSSRASMR
jgi:hypothetical protein